MLFVAILTVKDGSLKDSSAVADILNSPKLPVISEIARWDIEKFMLE
jgi:hypothetical protein